jgi:DNA-binding YbaB/EbfC family protein
LLAQARRKTEETLADPMVRPPSRSFGAEVRGVRERRVLTMGKGFDLGGLFRQAQELQEKIANAQQELGGRTVEASAGGGMVTAVVNGKLEVVQIRIEPKLLEKPDSEMLQDLVVAAVNGVRAARRLIEDEMGS